MRTKQINVRLSPEELRKAKRLAKRWGCSLSDAIRMLVTSSVALQLPKPEAA